MTRKIIFLSAAVISLMSCNNSGQQTNDQENKTDTVAIPAITYDTTAAKTAMTTPYTNDLEFNKIRFTITSPQSSSGNSFTVTPSGYANSNDPMTMDCEGSVVKSEVADIDGDNAPELLVVTQMGDDKKGKAYVFSSNKTKSMSMVSLPDLKADPKNTAGYSGFDEFALVETSFSHRFPLYENGQPTNKTRQFQYKLKPGEAMKQLVLDKLFEF
jgi:uncharacterized lipoprotein NlpE involved in copper resistance